MLIPEDSNLPALVNRDSLKALEVQMLDGRGLPTNLPQGSKQLELSVLRAVPAAERGVQYEELEAMGKTASVDPRTGAVSVCLDLLVAVAAAMHKHVVVPAS